MQFIYNILFEACFILSAPLLFFENETPRRVAGRDFGERLGRYSTKFKQAISNRDVIWLHAVSVGEVNICVQLIKVLQPRLPNLKLVVSTTTTTGMSELHKNSPPRLARFTTRWIAGDLSGAPWPPSGPKAVVLIEAEIWPNFLLGAAGPEDLGTSS